MEGGKAERRKGGSAGTSEAGTELTAVPPYRRTALVIQTAFLGDVVLTTPLLSALAKRHGPVDVVTTPAAGSLLETHPAVRSVIRYDKHGVEKGWRGIRKLGSDLRARSYATAYLPHRSVRSAVLALLSGADERVGFSGSPAAITYTRRVPRPRTGHEVERLLALAGPDVASPPVTLGLTAADHRTAEIWLADHRVGPRFVALAPGSIWGTKRWPYYAELAAGLDQPCVVVGGADDSSLAEAIVAAAPGRAVSAVGALSLRVSAALIQRAAVLVTNDSAPLHLATAVGTPVLALFGSTVPAFGFGPRGRGDAALGVEGLTCRPCSRHGPDKCPLGHHRCMRELAVTTVTAALAAVASAEESRAICPRN
jgi:heptosyltransferase II